jgi:hypothetical protein
MGLPMLHRARPNCVIPVHTCTTVESTVEVNLTLGGGPLDLWVLQAAKWLREKLDLRGLL